MHRHGIFPILAVAMMVANVGSGDAQLIPQTFVSSSGSDANNCVSSTPCRTFNGALLKTQPRGEIRCLDTANYSAGIVIDKSITIDCAGTAATSASGNFVINGANIVVNLRNMALSAFGFGNLFGIHFQQGSMLNLHNVN